MTEVARVPRAEAELLRRAARARRSAAQEEEIARLSARPVDWDAFYRMARVQRVSPAVYAHLSAACPDAVPPEVMRALKREAYQSMAVGTALAKELVHLLRLFEAHSVRALPFKGPVLASVAYGRLDRRAYGDLDVLIEPGRFEKAEAALHARGYRPQFDFGQYRFGRRRKALFLRLESGLSFVHEEHPFALDLHLRLGPPRYSFALGFDELWARSQEVALQGTAVPTLGMVDRMQVICWHGAKHRWDHLKLIGDVAELVEAAPELDWDALLRQARRLQAERMLYTGLRLAHDVLGASPPPEVLRAISQDPQVGRLAAPLVPQLFAERAERAGYFQRHAFQLRMRGGWAAKLRYALSTLVFNRLSRRALLGVSSPT